METSCSSQLHQCLYFSANKFTRLITKVAEDCFRKTGISPTYAFAMTVINQMPGIASKDLADKLHMAPSTITRFVDKLVSKSLVERRIEGKSSLLFPTKNGKDLQAEITSAWKDLKKVYEEKIGYDEGKKLINLMNNVSEKIEK